MSIMNTPVPLVEIVAILSTATSRCEIEKRQRDDESGDLIESRCGAITKPLGTALKGVSISPLSACEVVMTVNAVHSPRLLKLSNCQGPLTVVDVGSAWTNRLRKRADVETGSIEYVTYLPTEHRIGCYRVTIAYDAKPSFKNTPYKERVGEFCINKR